MDNKDIILLQYLAKFTEPVKFVEEDAPYEIKVNFQFQGLDRFKNPDSIHFRLFELSKWKLVKSPYSDMWEITESGRTELRNHLNNKKVVSEETLLRYFVKQNKSLSIDDLFKKYQTGDSILIPINYLVDNDWLEEVDPLNWQITNEGRVKFERRQMVNNPHNILNNINSKDLNSSNNKVTGTKKMKIFISWSGDRSKEIALGLKDFLINLFQGDQIFMSEHDIAAGTRWRNKLNNELEGSKFGIVCLTPENLNAEWLLFEAGALSKAVNESFVVPYLFDLKSTMPDSPLSEFQSVLASESGTLRLITSINGVREHQLPSEQLTKAFSKWWPDFKSQLYEIPPIKIENGDEPFSIRYEYTDRFHYKFNNQSFNTTWNEIFLSISQSLKRNCDYGAINNSIIDFLVSSVANLNDYKSTTEAYIKMWKPSFSSYMNWD